MELCLETLLHFSSWACLESILPIASMRVEGFNWTWFIPCLPPIRFPLVSIPGFAVVVGCCCRRDANACLAQPTRAQRLSSGGWTWPCIQLVKGQGAEGLVRCCREPSDGAGAEPLPVDVWLPVRLWGWGHGAACPFPGDTWKQPVGTCEVSTGQVQRRAHQLGGKGCLSFGRISPVCISTDFLQLRSKGWCCRTRTGKTILWSHEAEPWRRGWIIPCS